jgi:alpha-L-fucosidase 2
VINQLPLLMTRSALFLIFLALTCCTRETTTPLRLWYTEPADASVADNPNGWQNDPEWLKALPVGNGFIGAMVFGDTGMERIQLNEKSLWSGSYYDNDNPDAFASLGKIRELLFAGKYREATELTLKTQVCRGAGSGHGNGANVPFGCFQTLGDLWIDFDNKAAVKDYHRELDLENAIVRVSYSQDGENHHREIFASYPDRCIVIHLKSGTKGSLDFNCQDEPSGEIRDTC